MIQTDFHSNFYEDSKSVFIFQIKALIIEILRDKVKSLVRESFLKENTGLMDGFSLDFARVRTEKIIEK